MIKKWECNKIDEEKIEEFSKENNVSRLLSKVLLSRGFSNTEEVQKFLNPKLEELYDPFLINDMDYYKRKNRFLAIENELNRKMTYAIIKRLRKDK